MSKIDDILKEHHSGEEIEKYEDIKREYRNNAVYADDRVLYNAWKVVVLPVAMFAIVTLLFCYTFTVESDKQIPMGLFLSFPYQTLFVFTVMSCGIWWPPKNKRKIFEEGVQAIYLDKRTILFIFAMVAIQIISAMWIVFMK